VHGLVSESRSLNGYCKSKLDFEKLILPECVVLLLVIWNLSVSLRQVLMCTAKEHVTICYHTEAHKKLPVWI